MQRTTTGFDLASGRAEAGGGFAGEQRTAWQHERATLPPLPKVEWHLDPIERALQNSTWRTGLPPAFCVELGRRILLAHLESNQWILRRVEQVAFERDRSVSRRIAVEVSVRDDAPVFVDKNRRRYWLVPLSRLNRRTLVNLDLRDDQNRVVTMPGMRLTQEFDQSLILAAAAAVNPDYVLPGSDPRAFAEKFVAGKRPQVMSLRRELAEGRTGLPPELTDNPLFAQVVRWLSKSFTLYVFLPVEHGSSRLLYISFDEPTDWKYQRPYLRPVDEKQPDSPWQYKSGQRVPWHERTHLLASFGLRPTRIRLQVPGAEAAASYHFEATAPQGVRFVDASLIAGRPNEPEQSDPADRVSSDHVIGHSPTIGLHAVEVPSGSLCRVQLDLGTPIRGLMTTMLVSSWLILAVLISVAYHALRDPINWELEELPNIVLMLVTTSAGAAALIAQAEIRGAAARMLARTRAMSVLTMVLPVVAAGFLVYGGRAPSGARQFRERTALGGLVALAVLITAATTVAWALSWWAGRRTVVCSPWDMTLDDDDVPPNEPTPQETFAQTCERYGFFTPAIGIRSAEAWHECYEWNDKRQHDAVVALHSEWHIPASVDLTVSPQMGHVQCAAESCCRLGSPGDAAHAHS